MIGALGAFQLGSDIISNLFNFGMNQATNQTNKAIADDNRRMQSDWNQIQFDYNKALQQQIFDREDTAFSRQAADMARAGINPLSQNLQGAGAGTPIPSNLAAPQNNFQAQQPAPMSFTPLASLVQTMNGVETGEYQRDSLALQNDAQFLQNLEQANKLGINYHGYLPYETGGKGYRSNTYKFFENETGKPLEESEQYKGSLGSAWNKNRMESLPSWEYALDSAGKESVYDKAEKALTKIAGLYDNAFSNMFDKYEAKSIYELGKGKKAFFNPANFLLRLFGFNAQ